VTVGLHPLRRSDVPRVVDLAKPPGWDAVLYLKIPDSDQLAWGAGNAAGRVVRFLGVTAESEFLGI
jgi:hypothetical protein